MNTKLSIEDRITQLICDELGCDEKEVVPSASIINDLGADSLDQVELIMSLEEEFSLEVSNAEAEKLNKVSDVVSYVKAHVKGS